MAISISGRAAREFRVQLNKCKDKPTSIEFEAGHISLACQVNYPHRKYEILGIEPPNNITIKAVGFPDIGGPEQFVGGKPVEGISSLYFDEFNVPSKRVFCDVNPRDITEFIKKNDSVVIDTEQEQLKLIFSDQIKASLGKRC